MYVLFLPTLAAQAGIPGPWVIGLLMLDQLVFFVAEYACGVASDLRRALNARSGPAIAMAPHLGLALKGLDPRWPFALATVGVVAAALLLALAERATPAVAAQAAVSAKKQAAAHGRLLLATAAALLAAGFDAALALGQGGRQGRCSGALSSTLAFAALLRMGLVASGLAATLRTADASLFNLLPALLWAAAALLLMAAWRCTSAASPGQISRH